MLRDDLLIGEKRMTRKELLVLPKDQEETQRVVRDGFFIILHIVGFSFMGLQTKPMTPFLLGTLGISLCILWFWLDIRLQKLRAYWEARLQPILMAYQENKTQKVVIIEGYEKIRMIPSIIVTFWFCWFFLSMIFNLSP